MTTKKSITLVVFIIMLVCISGVLNFFGMFGCVFFSCMGHYKLSCSGLPYYKGDSIARYLKYENEHYYGDGSIVYFKGDGLFTELLGYTCSQYGAVIEVKGIEGDEKKDFLKVGGETLVKGSTLEKFYNTPVDEISYSYYNEEFYIQTQESLSVNDLMGYNVEKGSDLYEELRGFGVKSQGLDIIIPNEYDYVEEIIIVFYCFFKDGVYYIKTIDTQNKPEDYDCYKICAVKEEYYYLFEDVHFS